MSHPLTDSQAINAALALLKLWLQAKGSVGRRSIATEHSENFATMNQNIRLHTRSDQSALTILYTAELLTSMFVP